MRYFMGVALISSLGLNSPILGQGKISTFAGREWVFEDNAKLALEAPLGRFLSLARSPQGELYISDRGNRHVFRLSADGSINIVVGSGQAGSSADGTPAIEASLTPGAIAFDPLGRLLVADGGSIRYVDQQGRLQTLSNFFASTVEFRDRGVGRPSYLRYNRDGVLHVLSSDVILRAVSATQFQMVAGGGTIPNAPDGTAAVNYLSNSTTEFDFDSEGRIVFIDGNACRLRRVNANGTLETIAGNATCEASQDGTLARGASIRPFSGGVRIGSDGLMYFADNSRMRRIDRAGRFETISGPIRPGFTPLVPTESFAVYGFEVTADGRLWIEDGFTQRLYSIGTTPNSNSRHIAGNGCFMPPNPRPSSALGIFINRGPAVSLDRSGRVLLTTGDPRSTYRVSPAGIAQLSYGDTAATCSAFGVVPRIPGAATGPSFAQEDSEGRIYYMHIQGVSLYRIGANGDSILVAGAEGNPSNAGVNFSGDGGPATQAIMRAAPHFWLGPDGDIWIPDISNHRIRHINKNGIIRTVAGNGMVGFTGDLGQGQAASLNSPAAVTGDRNGNIYIADSGNNAIRLLRPTGIITTIAGTGVRGSSGDGGPATVARLANPRGIWFDSIRGELYIAETGGHRIRKIDSEGIITTVAGIGEPGYSGDGGPATEAMLNSPSTIALDDAGILYIGDDGNRRVRRVFPQGATAPGDPCAVSTSTRSSYFRAEGGVARALILTGTDCAVNVGSLANWIKVITGGEGRGSRELIFEISANVARTGRTAALRIGPETIVVRQAGGPSIIANPSFISVSSYPGQLKLSVPLTLSLPNAASAPAFPVFLTNTTDKEQWLGISKTSGNIEPNKQLELSLELDPRGLAPGTYRGSVEILNSLTGEELRLPVTMLVSASQRKLQLSHNGFSFRSHANGGPLNEALGVGNGGTSNLSWTATATTTSGGNWLSVNSASGSIAPGANYTQVQILANPANLAPGQYYGSIQVRAVDSLNSLQVATVVLSVEASAEPTLAPSNLAFVTTGNALPPQPQSALIRNNSSTSITFSSSVDFGLSSPWFTVANGAGTIAPGQGASLEIRPSQANLSPGVYRSQVLVTVQGVTTPLRLSVTHVVAPNSQSGSSCTPLTITPVIVSPASRFVAAPGWPIALRVLVVDNCGSPLRNGLVSATPSNGDPEISLEHVGSGFWTGTWTVRKFSTGPATVSFRAKMIQTAVAGDSPIQGQISTIGVPPPIIAAGGVLNAASFERRATVAAGSMVSIFGSNFGREFLQASTIPLPPALDDLSILVGDRVAPLYFSSPSQVNAQVPFEVSLDEEHSFVVRRGFALSVPEIVPVSRAAPAIFTVDGSGTGQAHVYRYGGDGSVSLAIASSGIAPGETAVFYATGLGLTLPRVLSGVAAPVPAATIQSLLVVRVAGRSALVSFAGLAPGFVGLYQVNFVMPAGIPGGSEVTLELELGGVRSAPTHFSAAIVK